MPNPRPYDGIQAGLDAFRLAEEQRQTLASYQLTLNDHLKFWSGLPTSRGETIYYGYASPAYAGYAPGSLLIYPLYPTYYPQARQPIGQRQQQTGPNRWESHPVYYPPLTPYRPLPLVDSPLLSGTPYAAPPAPFAEPAPAQPAARSSATCPAGTPRPARVLRPHATSGQSTSRTFLLRRRLYEEIDALVGRTGFARLISSPPASPASSTGRASDS